MTGSSPIISFLLLFYKQRLLEFIFYILCALTLARDCEWVRVQQEGNWKLFYTPLEREKVLHQIEDGKKSLQINNSWLRREKLFDLNFSQFWFLLISLSLSTRENHLTRDFWRWLKSNFLSFAYTWLMWSQLHRYLSSLLWALDKIEFFFLLSLC